MNSQIGCVIVDDEPLAIRILSKYINKHDKLYLIKSFTRSTEAISYLESNKTDLLLLDIHMPLINGIELIKKLKNPPQTIFTTAYREHAVEGFELNAMDYLVKPIRYERFTASIERIKARIQASETNIPNSAEDVLNIKMNRKNYRIPLDDILYLESNRNNVLIFTTQKEFKCVDTLKHMAKKLPNNFVQIHRSFIINNNFVEHYDKQEVKVGLKKLPIGSKFSDSLEFI